jgi:hypothetical protein
MSLSVKYIPNGARKNKPVLVSMAVRGLLVTKGKVHPRTGHESPGESRCISLLLLEPRHISNKVTTNITTYETFFWL